MDVKIDYYRYAGRFLFYKAKDRCLECEMTYSILHRLDAEVFSGKNIKINIKPFFNHLIPLFFKKAYRPPLVYINDKLFSQGIVPDARILIRKIGTILEDREILESADSFANYRKSKSEIENVDLPLIYFSPGCPHCRALILFLDTNNVKYNEKNIVDDSVAREEMIKISPLMTIPVIVFKNKILYGFNKEELKNLLDLKSENVISVISNPNSEPDIDREALKKTVSLAKKLLEENRDGDITRASAHLYPHQWSWDAAFITRGLLHYDPAAAYREISSLFRGQWSDGFLPHIVFNDNYLDHFPGPDYWKGERSGRVPKGVFTSGISQPPVHASMLCRAYELDPDKKRALEQLNRLYLKLESFHDYFFNLRTSESNGLVYLIHPWESGLDNAPLWDKALVNITKSTNWSLKMQNKYDELAAGGKRPSRTYINKYSYLVESLFSRNYNWDRIGKEHEFRICDVLFNTVLCRSERDLGEIAKLIGKDYQLHYDRSDELKRNINRHLWDETDGFYYDYDLVSGEFIKRDTVFSYLPLYGNIASVEQGEKLIGHLKSHCFCVADRDCMGIPSYDMCTLDYDGEFYWRGPIWFNMSWYVYHGFKNYGYDEDAKWLRQSLFKLVIENGFYEYYKPENGKGLGADRFSWTAALFIDLFMEEKI